MVDVVLNRLKGKMTEARSLDILRQKNKPITETGADRTQLEDAGAYETLIEAMIDPATVPCRRRGRREAAAAQENTAKQRERDTACRAQATAGSKR